MTELGGGFFAVPPEIAARRLANLLADGDPSDPLLMTSLPAFLMDAIASANFLPYERCVDDCMILAHAYAQFGVDAEVRVAELEVTVRRDGTTATYGRKEPWWEDDMLHGHSVVWLPGPRHLVDPTAEQFAEIAAGTGPVIIARTEVPAVDEAVGPAGSFRVSLERDDVLLTYSVAPAATAIQALEHPVVMDSASGNRRRGMNIASATIIQLAESFSPDEVRLMPNKRAAALAEAIRALPAEQIHSGDWRFRVPRPAGTSMLTRIDRLPLPDGTPPIALIGPDISGRLP